MQHRLGVGSDDPVDFMKRATAYFSALQTEIQRLQEANTNLGNEVALLREERDRRIRAEDLAAELQRQLADERNSRMEREREFQSSSHKMSVLEEIVSALEQQMLMLTTFNEVNPM